MNDEHHNPFLEPALVTGYEEWYDAEGARADQLEKALLKKLLAMFHDAHTLLDVGCGTGHFTRWFQQLGLEVTGLDASPAMLAEAQRLGSPTCVEGDALDLPFDDQSYDLVSLITALEFVGSPERALSEAVRVARHGLLVGALNRQSQLGRELEKANAAPWNSAHFFTPADLEEIVKEAAGPRLAGLLWRTTLWPSWSNDLPLPGGGFIGMAVQLTS